LALLLDAINNNNNNNNNDDDDDDDDDDILPSIWRGVSWIAIEANETI
jgi:hypothetical protein